MAESTDRKTLIAELANARDTLTGYTAALRHDMDFGANLKRRVRGNPTAWFGGAALFGLLLSRIPPLRRKPVVRGPIFARGQAEQAGKVAFGLTILKFVLDFARPTLLRWVKERYLNRANRRAA